MRDFNPSATTLLWKCNHINSTTTVPNEEILYLGKYADFKLTDYCEDVPITVGLRVRHYPDMIPYEAHLILQPNGDFIMSHENGGEPETAYMIPEAPQRDRIATISKWCLLVGVSLLVAGEVINMLVMIGVLK